MNLTKTEISIPPKEKNEKVLDLSYSINNIVQRVGKLSQYYSGQIQTKMAKKFASHLEGTYAKAKDEVPQLTMVRPQPPFANKQKEIKSKGTPNIEQTFQEQKVSLSIEQIIQNLVEEGEFNQDHLVYSYALFERYLHTTKLHGDIDLEKLFSTAAFLAHKFIEEGGNWFFPEFGKMTGISVKEAQILEVEFCKGIQFQFYISTKLFRHYARKIKKQADF